MDNLEIVGLTSFVGGMSVDRKFGTENQFYNSRHIDFRKKPSQFSVLPKTAKTSGGVVVDLVQDMVMVPSGICYAVGNAGSIYKITAAGIWSRIGTLGENGGADIHYRADSDAVYITGISKIARIKAVSTAPVLQLDWFQEGVSSDSNAYKVGGANLYTLATAINEATINRRLFIPDIEPFSKIGVHVIAKGTGDWTLTLHDDMNNTLEAVTIASASVNSNSMNYFVFSSPIRALVAPNARNYHFHLTSTVADGTLQTTTSASMADCDMELWANALVSTTNGLHPMINFSQFTLIGNGRYVATYEPLQDMPTTSDYNRHEIVLPPGFEVCGFAQKNQFAVIGAEKRTSANEIQEGALFFWDGVSETYNDWYPVPEGSPESLFSHKNIVTYVCNGALYRMKGMEEPVKIRTFRNTDSEYSDTSDSTHSYPGMTTVRRGIMLVGYPGITTNQSLEHGVYSLGAVSREYPESFGYSYSISTATRTNNGSNNLRIGMVKNFGDTLYVSWRDDQNGGYGIDVVNNSSDPFSSFTIESLYFDDERPFVQKKASSVVATFKELPSDVSINLKYKIDQESGWHYLNDDGTAKVTSGTYAVMPVEKPFYGIEFGLDGTVDGTTTPEILSLYLAFDPNKEDLGVLA